MINVNGNSGLVIEELYLAAGYYVEVTSWENDGDDYRTKRVKADSIQYANFLKDGALLCESHNSSALGLGNMGEHDSFKSAQYDLILSLFKKYEDVVKEKLKDTSIYEFITSDSPDIELVDIDEVIDQFQELAVYPLLGYSEYYTFRVTEKVKLFEVETDVYVNIYENWSGR